jgi:DNA polymerase III epsilon subunit-like protein
LNTLLFDTETTGLIANSLQRLEKQPHIIEFYGCLIDDNGTAIEEIEFLCNPGIPIPLKVTQITGFTDRDVKDLPKIDVYFDKMKVLIEKADAVVAHNLGYDRPLVDFEAKRLGKEIKWPPLQLCTVEQTEHLKGYRLSLTALHELLFNQPFNGAHRAKEDVSALIRCYVELKKKGEL